MINLKKLKIENFFVIKEADVEFESGLYFVTGENRDESTQYSNGAGKSLFCSAIVWALYDDLLTKGAKKDDVVGPSGDFTAVTLELEAQGKHIKIERFRGHSKHRDDVLLTVDGDDLTQHKKADTNELIERYLGVSKNVLYHCAFTYEDSEALPSLTSSKLNQVVSEIIDTSCYDDWLKEARSRKREYERETELLSKDHTRFKDNLESTMANIEDVKSSIDEFQGRYSARIEEIETDIEATKKSISDYKALLKKESKVKADLEKLKPVAKEYKSLALQQKGIKRDMEENDSELRRMERQINKIEADMQQSKSNLETLTKNPSGQCDVCGNYLQDSNCLEDKVIRFQEEVDKYQVKLVDKRVDVEKVTNRKRLLKSQLKKVEDNIEKTRDKIQEYNRLEEKLSKFEQLRKFLDKEQLKLTKLENSLKGEPDSPASLEARLDELKESVKDIEKQMKQSEKDLKHAMLSFEAAEALEGALKASKAARFNSFIYRLQDISNAYLSKMTDGDYSCRLDESKGELGLSFTAPSKLGEYYSYHVFSKGERARISKAISTALNSMMGLNFLVDDEGLDGLDDAGIQHVLDFITDINSDKTFIFVGHQKSVHDYFKDATNIHIIKEGGKSTVQVIK